MVANAKRHADHGNAEFHQVTQRVTRAGAEARDEAKALKEQAFQKAEQLTHSIKEESSRFLRDQKKQVAGRIERAGSVMHQAAQVLERGEIVKLAEYVDMAAVGATATSKYLEEREIDEIAEDAAEIVRRHPLATFGAMVLAGLAAGRFVKAGRSGKGSRNEGRRPRSGGRRRRTGG